MGMCHIIKKKIKEKKTIIFLGHLTIRFRGAKGVFRGQVLTHKIPFLDKIEFVILTKIGVGGCQT